MAEQLLSSTIKPVKRSLTLPIYSIIDGTLNDSDSMSFMPKKFDYHRWFPVYNGFAGILTDSQYDKWKPIVELV